MVSPGTNAVPKICLTISVFGSPVPASASKTLITSARFVGAETESTIAAPIKLLAVTAVPAYVESNFRKVAS